MKILRHYVFRIGLVLFCLVLIEACYFSYILCLRDSDVRSDAILVFTGAEKRIEKGYELANKGLAPAIVLSPATKSHRSNYDLRYAVKDTVSHIPEDQAATTFENALYTSRIVLANGCKNIILVTSDYHMPRSLAMLELLLAGKDIRVHLHLVHGAADGAVVNATLLKLVYNEMVEFWGSLFEYASYQIRGVPAEKPVKRNALSLFLRSVVLLDVKQSW